LARDEKWLLWGLILLIVFEFCFWNILKHKESIERISSSFFVEDTLNQVLLSLGIKEENIREKFWREKGKEVVGYQTIHLPSHYTLGNFLRSLRERLAKKGIKVRLEEKGKDFLKLAIGSAQRITHYLRLESNSLPLISIVVDDVGYGGEGDRLALSLPSPVTLSILPQLPYSPILASRAHERGMEVLLHQPLESLSPDIERTSGLLKRNMGRKEMAKILTANLKTVPYACGVNNHEGSLALADERFLKNFFSLLKERDLFFLDSLTTSKSKSFQVGEELSLPVLRRDVFLDNRKEEKYIKEQLQELISRARVQGYAIGICHAHPLTMKVLLNQLPDIEKKARLVTLSHLLEAKSSLKP